jgi:large subunit ribosomal protein L23
MAIFKRNNTESTKEKTAASRAERNAPAKTSVPGNTDTMRVLRNPRITEKATQAAEAGAYVFEIDPRAGKQDVIRAVLSIYNVKPEKVNITPIHTKQVRSRTKRGVFGRTALRKKAYVYLKKGDSIEIV